MSEEKRVIQGVKYDHPDPTPDQVNKYLAERMGEYVSAKKLGYVADAFPDYHTAPGFFKLWIWLEDEGYLTGFIKWFMEEKSNLTFNREKVIHISALFRKIIDYDELPTLCAEWLKGGER